METASRAAACVDGEISQSQTKQGKCIFVSLNPAVPTAVFDTYWRFAAERQRIFYARVKGETPPWSVDPIFNEYKFTNAYRASDRVSQYLIRNVIYTGSQETGDLFFRIVLFKLFNKIETWNLLSRDLGELRWASFRYADYDRVLSRALLRGATIYSAAYIMASGHEIFGVTRKHQSHLRLIELMMKEGVPQKLQSCRSMRQAFELLRSYPLIGDFLAYQLVTDLNYSDLTAFSEMDFTMPGPGARDGIRKCFTSLGGLNEADIIRMMADRQEHEFERLAIDFRSLWGRPLQLIDIQNLFCEVDKYSRVKHPDIAGISGRTRIKQRFKETGNPIDYFYPPKWMLDVEPTDKLRRKAAFQHLLL
jgi:hypothetical protein